MTTTSNLASLLGNKPRLRFEEMQMPNVGRLQIPVTPRPLPPSVTPANPIHPHSPFPVMEAPHHDVISSHLFLPDNRKLVTPASPLHPASPFPRLEAPKPDIDPILKFLQDYNTRFRTGTDPTRNNNLSLNPGPTENPGSFNANPRHEKSLGTHSLFQARPRPESPPNFPVPRTRMIAPHSNHSPLIRRLNIDGPTERSLTPLEILAKKTVPKYKPDSSFFGTPRSRVEDNKSPLESIVSNLRQSEGRGDKIFEEVDPVQRIRHQRKSAGDNRPALTFQDQGGPAPRQKVQGAQSGEWYSELPGVKTGTTAVGLVEHRDGSQPLFHVPVFTTPIPRNGQFIKLNPKPISSIRTAVKKIKNVLSSPVESLLNVKKVLQNTIGQSKEVSVSGPNRPMGFLGNFRQLPQPTQRSTIGRTLSKFPSYTKRTNFLYSSSQSAPSLNVALFTFSICTFILHYSRFWTYVQ